MLVAACAPVVKVPTVRVTGVRTGDGDSTQVAVAVTNPNRLAFDLRSVDYVFAAGVETLASGRRTAPLRIAAHDSTTAEFPISVRFARALTMLPAIARETIDCRVRGEYSVPTVLGARRGRFNETLRFSAREQLKQLFGGLFD